MNDALDRYQRISAGFAARLDGIAQDQWHSTCPSCPEWDVTALVAHVIGNHRAMLSSVAEGPAAAEGATPAAEWAALRERAIGAVQDPDAATKVVSTPFGELSYTNLVGGVLCADTLFHTWDLARATGQDEHLEDRDCEAVLAFLSPLDAGLRGPGRFGPSIEAPAGADAKTRLLCFGGRRG